MYSTVPAPPDGKVPGPTVIVPAGTHPQNAKCCPMLPPFVTLQHALKVTDALAVPVQ